VRTMARRVMATLPLPSTRMRSAPRALSAPMAQQNKDTFSTRLLEPRTPRCWRTRPDGSMFTRHGRLCSSTIRYVQADGQAAMGCDWAGVRRVPQYTNRPTTVRWARLDDE